ncbi:hypothetical protein T265_04230 [Opisthorchis viverrini]|uniref:Uncharacterized protein n=1 Tax=Opisthorchis viverrini TaxID=6198 RepID=A0A074ZPK5_OPIVI|nr:hypothetical protein T265_04230 [Opisthorchis viverrini]KER29041.1 hypothetical protein T265_04230 [Opisthorchis viverrini]
MESLTNVPHNGRQAEISSQSTISLLNEKQYKCASVLIIQLDRLAPSNSRLSIVPNKRCVNNSQMKTNVVYVEVADNGLASFVPGANRIRFQG